MTAAGIRKQGVPWREPTADAARRRERPAGGGVSGSGGVPAGAGSAADGQSRPWRARGVRFRFRFWTSHLLQGHHLIGTAAREPQALPCHCRNLNRCERLPLGPHDANDCADASLRIPSPPPFSVFLTFFYNFLLTSRLPGQASSPRFDTFDQGAHRTPPPPPPSCTFSYSELAAGPTSSKFLQINPAGTLNQGLLRPHSPRFKMTRRSRFR